MHLTVATVEARRHVSFPLLTSLVAAPRHRRRWSWRSLPEAPGRRSSASSACCLAWPPAS